MSGVVKSKQHTTTIKFIEVARQLDIFTLRMVQKLPKRTAFYLNVHLTDLSNNIVRCVQIANSIYISTPQDFEQRRALLLEARGCCQALSSKVDLVVECAFKRDGNINSACIAPGNIKQWVNLLREETALLTGVLRTDKETLKRLGVTQGISPGVVSPSHIPPHRSHRARRIHHRVSRE
ncbi:MAG: hypothetical protein RR204_05955 [Raoultibacter sp.]